MLRIEAVTVSLNYGDFLSETAAVNRHLFSRWLVVTHPGDTETREVCRRYGLETLLTEEVGRDGAFSKGRLIDRALHQLGGSSWRLHLDADIALPGNLLQLLEAAHLDEGCVYGWDRLMCVGWERWQQVKASGFLHGQLDYHCRVHFAPGLELGARWAHPRHGWVPIGWAQLWHAAADEWHGIRVRGYAHHHGDACRTDVQFGMQWDRRRRVFLPEVVAVHLESEPAELGANWNGRTTRRFGPPGASSAAAYTRSA
jgi:hypothetical protein